MQAKCGKMRFFKGKIQQKKTSEEISSDEPLMSMNIKFRLIVNKLNIIIYQAESICNPPERPRIDDLYIPLSFCPKGVPKVSL